MKTVSILNHKGGVGKTTFAGCLGQALALTGFRVLVIDNDSQHNLTTLLGSKVFSPNIRDVYLCGKDSSAQTLLKAIRKTEIPQLHIVTSPGGMTDADVESTGALRTCVQLSGLHKYYDYALIDNAPGMGRLQSAAVEASDEIFVPTELKQFAVDGIAEMESMLSAQFPNGPRITRIIPNFYRNTKRQNSYLVALNTLFSGRITKTALPIDAVFDEMVTEGKVLFLHRLYSRGAAFYLKIMHELFDLDPDTLWQTMLEKRRLRISEDARERFHQRQIRSQATPPQP